MSLSQREPKISCKLLTGGVVVPLGAKSGLNQGLKTPCSGHSPATLRARAVFYPQCLIPAVSEGRTCLKEGLGQAGRG